MAIVVDWFVGALIFVLRQVLRIRYWLLAGLIAYAMISALRFFPSVDPLMYWCGAALFVVLFAVADGAGSSQKSPFYWNYDASKRRDRIEELVRSCNRSLLIVSGEFNHETFESEGVVSALKAVPATAEIELYITDSEVDPKSVRFIAWVRDRGLKVGRIDQDIAHRIVVDDMNIRVEFRHSGLFGTGRPAMVAYGEPRLACEARRAVHRALTVT
jgi:hypothetical protein